MLQQWCGNGALGSYHEWVTGWNSWTFWIFQAMKMLQRHIRNSGIECSRLLAWVGISISCTAPYSLCSHILRRYVSLKISSLKLSKFCAMWSLSLCIFSLLQKLASTTSCGVMYVPKVQAAGSNHSLLKYIRNRALAYQIIYQGYGYHLNDYKRLTADDDLWKNKQKCEHLTTCIVSIRHQRLMWLRMFH